jgi:hypothetical protein
MCNSRKTLCPGLCPGVFGYSDGSRKASLVSKLTVLPGVFDSPRKRVGGGVFYSHRPSGLFTYKGRTLKRTVKFASESCSRRELGGVQPAYAVCIITYTETPERHH